MSTHDWHWECDDVIAALTPLRATNKGTELSKENRPSLIVQNFHCEITWRDWLGGFLQVVTHSPGHVSAHTTELVVLTLLSPLFLSLLGQNADFINTDRGGEKWKLFTDDRIKLNAPTEIISLACSENIQLKTDNKKPLQRCATGNGENKGGGSSSTKSPWRCLLLTRSGRTEGRTTTRCS